MVPDSRREDVHGGNAAQREMRLRSEEGKLMAILFCDSFSAYRTANIPLRWKGGAYGQAPSITSAFLPPGAQAGAQVLLQNHGGVLTDNYGPQSRWIIGARIYISPDFSHAGAIFQVNNGMQLTRDGSGTYILNNVGTVIATGPIIPETAWNHVEFDVVNATTAVGSVKVYLNGNPTPFMSVTNIVTTPGPALPSQVFCGSVGGGGLLASIYYADFYLLNGVNQVAGPINFNAPLAPQGFGAPKMAFAVPGGAGRVSAWTANGAATIWQSINQIPQDGDTTYASDATPGDAFMCTIGALPAMQSLLAVQLSTAAREDDAGPRSYQSGFGNGVSEGYSGVDQYLPGTYTYIEDEFAINPITGLAWTPSDLVGLQIGAKLTN
jgi:hypothetical protein